MSDLPPPPDLREAREDWALAFALLGAHGYRPKLAAEALLAYRRDGATITITGRDGKLPPPTYDTPLTLTLRIAEGSELETETIRSGDDRQLVQLVITRFAQRPIENLPEDGFIRDFPPAGELDRLTLSAAYAAYRPELDALAASGIHAYLEDSGFGIRIYCDVSQSLLLDISIDDEGLPPVGPQEGGWVVFITGPDGHEAEFTVDRLDDRDEAASALADAVTHALARVLREGQVFLEHYNPHTRRLDPPWWRAPE
jgi:hypothetical protein